jgi:hypothetical protein
MPNFYDFLANPSGFLVDQFYETDEAPVVPSSFVQPVDPYAEESEEQARRLEAISSGQRDDPSVNRMRQQLALAGQQAYGEASSRPMQSAAAQGRLARGARAAVRRDAPRLLEAQRLQSQQAAQEELIRKRQQQRDLEQRRLEAEKNAALQAQIQSRDLLQRNREAQDQSTTDTGKVVMKIIGSLLSDKRAKKDIKPGAKKTREFLDSLSAKEFKYKNGGGAQIGIIAQDANKSKQGRAMTEEVGDLLTINTGQATGPMLAALADLNERIKKLER